MKYISLFSGIEAATQAWEPLGWEPLWFCENEKFASAVLSHRYPQIPNLGDINDFKQWPDASPDLIVGGSPCQAFSVAGLRQGLADPRGQLMLTYLAVVDRYRPRWVLWENVAGVLSSRGGRDFGAFLGALGELGYGFAYRVLDAQHVRTQRFRRAVPQRRRRVFVVGCLGGAARAGEVLFEREGMLWNPPPRREARKEVAADAVRCVDGGVPAVANPLTRRMDKGVNTECDEGQTMIAETVHTLRRLTVRECERLQGFPDDFTQIPWRNKRAENCPDGPRYKALGNSMAVNVMDWIGHRIGKVDART